MHPTYSLRLATPADVPALQALIAHSGIALSVGFYTDAQAQAVTREVFGVDSQLIRDGSYYAITHGEHIVACGGWSQRATVFGGDQTKQGEDPLLDPAQAPARIRAFFVSPDHARKGLGRMLMERCLQAAAQAGFQEVELVSTLPGEPLYMAYQFQVIERFALHLSGGVDVPVTRMRRPIVLPAVAPS
jgi:GNAT superfamily N-acetyltransferase